MKPIYRNLFSFKPYAILFVQIALSNTTFAFTSTTAVHDLGLLTDLKTLKNKGKNIYKFRIQFATPVSIFLNGLSTGYQIELQNPKGEVLEKASNLGTHWASPTNCGETDGSIVLALTPGSYFVHVSPISILDRNIYRVKDQSFTLNLIPDNAPRTVIVAASDSPLVGTPQFKDMKKHDNKAINQAIALIGTMGGGRVLLRPGTYHINNNVKATFDNLTIMGTGWKTVLKLTDNVKMQGAGLLRSRYIDNSRNARKNHFTNQHFMHLVLDGNKARSPYFISSVGNYGTYVNSSFEDIRAHDFPRYGLDPHESIFESDTPRDSKITTPTSGLVIKDSLIDHNDQDGIVFEKTVDSIITGNIIDSNGRHGINIVAESLGNEIYSNVISNNLGNGVTIQPGQDVFRLSNSNHVHDNLIQHNAKNGIHLFRTSNTMINQNVINNNGWYGIHLLASSNNKISENILNNNSRIAQGSYAGINLSGDEKIFSTKNLISKNHLETLKPTTYKFGIVEHDAQNDFNQILKNSLININKPIRLKGSHSIEIGNEI